MEEKTSKVIKQFKIGFLRVYILFTVSENRIFGTELIKKAKSELGLVVSPGTLYPILHEMAKQGLIKSTGDDSSNNSNRRIYYEITTSGKKTLTAFCLQTKREILKVINYNDNQTQDDA